MTGKKFLYFLGTLAISIGAGYLIFDYQNVRKDNLFLSDTLTGVNEANHSLKLELASTTAMLSAIQNQLGGLTTTVSTLEKLKDTDPELLEKYSKVYFLSENYTPKGLIAIDNQYKYDTTKEAFFLSKAYPFLTRMMNAATADGLDLKIASSYRSFGYQSSLKSAYTVRYGSGANSFSADQGYSEHQLGTAVDFTTNQLKGALTGFDKTDEYRWLTENAYKYGFALSYPPKNSYYIYEPWHWRFVGINLATRLHEEKENFYDLEQRQIDPYLVKLFDSF